MRLRRHKIEVTLYNMEQPDVTITRKFFTKRGAENWTKTFMRLAWSKYGALYEVKDESNESA